jgi:Fe-S cluster biosynthesis and repair protein YggX
MMDENDRIFLEQEMVKYLFEGQDVIIEGFTPKA